MSSMIGRSALAMYLIGLAVLWPIGAATAGPNAEGVLIVHSSGAIMGTTAGETFCGLNELGRCLDARTRVDGDSLWVLRVYAAFPQPGTSSLEGVTFGVEHDQIGIGDYGGCGDDELDWPDWPNTGTGVSVSFLPPGRVGPLVELYWFIAYAAPGDVGSFNLGPHPDQGGFFLGGEPYPEVDAIDDYGRLGFGTDGYLPCPEPPTPAERTTWGEIKATFGR